MGKKHSKICITGGAGFIGSAFSREAVKKGFRISIIDSLNYAADLKRLDSIKSQFDLHKTSLLESNKIESILKKERPDYIVHFAAETHVDRSLLEEEPFIKANIIGTHNLLQAASQLKLKKFLHVSTDEVYGTILKGKFNEGAPLNPTNPYASSKAAGDLLVDITRKIYELPACTVRPCNIYGPWQYPEKFIPVIIVKALLNQKIPIYGKGQNVREWLYIDDCISAIFRILSKGKTGEIYNLTSGTQSANIQIAKKILHMMNKPQHLIQFVKDRLNHDFRYSLNAKKITNLKWKKKTNLQKGLRDTIDWYTSNVQWIRSNINQLNRYWNTVYQS